MEQIITLILFAFPGIFINLIFKEFLPQNRGERSQYEKTTIAFIFSFFVLGLNIFIMNFIFRIKENKVSLLLNDFGSISFLFKYIGLTFVTSIIIAIAWKGVEYIKLKIINCIRKLNKLPITTKFPSVWDEILYNKKNPIPRDQYISIHKDGKTIAQGLIALSSPINDKEIEFKLICTNEFIKYLENDKELPTAEKIFGKIDYEYFNVENNTLIKFYNNKKIIELLELYESNK